MAGDLEGKVDVPVDPARAFDRQPVWARIFVLSAGVIMNVILAFVLFAATAIGYGSAERATTPCSCSIRSASSRAVRVASHPLLDSGGRW